MDGMNSLKPAAEVGRSLLLVVLPYRVEQQTDTKKKGVRSFLAFPYGVLTIASYIEREARGVHKVHVLDLNIPSEKSEIERLADAIITHSADIVGFSMSYDISFKWLLRLSHAVRETFPSVVQIAGGPAVTTGYADIVRKAWHSTRFALQKPNSAFSTF